MDNRLMLLSCRAILILYKIIKRKCIIMSKRLVAYFSASGVTAKVAENLADAIGADVFEIQPEVPYTKADLNWMDKKSRSTIEMSDPTSRPAIAAKRDNMDEYDTICTLVILMMNQKAVLYLLCIGFCPMLIMYLFDLENSIVETIVTGLNVKIGIRQFVGQFHFLHG